jgi:tRNA 2-thiouridine synthesizing protein E
MTMNAEVKIHQQVSFDEGGFLSNPDDWNENIALTLAVHQGIEKLTDEHWKVLSSLRKHYDKFGVAPAMYNVCKSNGHDKHWVHNLFHTCLNAWLIAGLPDPGEEAKSYLSDM